MPLLEQKDTYHSYLLYTSHIYNVNMGNACFFKCKYEVYTSTSWYVYTYFIKS